jgi:hypothetical protein
MEHGQEIESDVIVLSGALSRAGHDVSADEARSAWSDYSRSVGARWRRIDNMAVELLRELAGPFLRGEDRHA